MLNCFSVGVEIYPRLPCRYARQQEGYHEIMRNSRRKAENETAKQLTNQPVIALAGTRTPEKAHCSTP
jgi:hypothetical protein